VRMSSNEIAVYPYNRLESRIDRADGSHAVYSITPFLFFQLVAGFHEMERSIQGVEVIAVVGACIEEKLLAKSRVILAHDKTSGVQIRS